MRIVNTRPWGYPTDDVEVWEGKEDESPVTQVIILVDRPDIQSI